MESRREDELVLTLSEVDGDSQEMNVEEAVSVALGHLSDTEREVA